MKYVQNIVLSLAVTAFFLWLSLQGIDFDLIDDTVKSTDWLVLVFPLVFWSFGLFARAMRWRGLLGKKVDKHQAIGIIGIVYMINATIPLRAGELVRLYLSTRSDNSISGWTVLTTVLTETLLDMMSIVLLMAFILPLLSISTATVITGAVIGVGALIGFTILLGFAHRPHIAYMLLEKLNHYVPFLQRLALENLLEKLLQGITPLSNWQALRRALFWTSIIWLSSILAVWSSAQALPEIAFPAVSLPPLILLLVATSLSAIVPFTMAGVGPFEAGVVFALGFVNISQETAITFGIILHVLMILHFILWGIISIFIIRLSITDMKGIGGYVRQKVARS